MGFIYKKKDNEMAERLLKEIEKVKMSSLSTIPIAI